MGIKLRTTIGRLKNVQIIPTEHDAAVAHALMRAIDGVLGKSARRDVYDMARKILRDDFGIDQE